MRRRRYSKPTGGARVVSAAGEPARTGVLLHGYGGDRDEVSALAAALAERLDARVLVPDLPGHGTRHDDPLTLAAALETVRALAAEAGAPLDFAVGHSLGARLALALDASAYVLLAMPGEPSFEGSTRDLVRALRPHRVHEVQPLAGLVEVLAAPLELPSRPALLLTPEDELETGVELARSWADAGLPIAQIACTDHRDIVASPAAIAAATTFLAEALR